MPQITTITRFLECDWCSKRIEISPNLDFTNPVNYSPLPEGWEKDKIYDWAKERVRNEM